MCVNNSVILYCDHNNRHRLDQSPGAWDRNSANQSNVNYLRKWGDFCVIIYRWVSTVVKYGIDLKENISWRSYKTSEDRNANQSEYYSKEHCFTLEGLIFKSLQFQE